MNTKTLLTLGLFKTCEDIFRDNVNLVTGVRNMTQEFTYLNVDDMYLFRFHTAHPELGEICHFSGLWDGQMVSELGDGFQVSSESLLMRLVAIPVGVERAGTSELATKSLHFNKVPVSNIAMWIGFASGDPSIRPMSANMSSAIGHLITDTHHVDLVHMSLSELEVKQ